MKREGDYCNAHSDTRERTTEKASIHGETNNLNIFPYETSTIVAPLLVKKVQP